MRPIKIGVEVHRLIEQHRRSFAEDENDILRRILPLVPSGRTAPGARASPASSSAAPAPGRGDTLSGAGASPPPPGTSRRGQFTVEVQGERISAANLKLAYRTLLETLDANYPDFLAAFAEEKGRSRRFVARTQAQLYAASPHLAKRHAALLAPGWYFDSNVSAVQVARRARIAARICGLRYGADVRVLDNLREI